MIAEARRAAESAHHSAPPRTLGPRRAGEASWLGGCARNCPAPTWKWVPRMTTHWSEVDIGEYFDVVVTYDPTIYSAAEVTR